MLQVDAKKEMAQLRFMDAYDSKVVEYWLPLGGLRTFCEDEQQAELMGTAYSGRKKGASRAQEAGYDQKQHGPSMAAGGRRRGVCRKT